MQYELHIQIMGLYCVYHHPLMIPLDEITPVIRNLQAEYKATRYISLADEWPPDQPKHFTAIALIHHQEKPSQQEAIGVANLVKQGIRSCLKLPSNVNNIDTMKPDKITKDISEVFTPKGGNVTESILIEGAPGIGKTVLCKEIAYQWATKQFLQDKLLLFLILLRDPHVQELKSVVEFVNYCCKNESFSKTVVDHLYKTQGYDLVILFDGYDEIGESIRQCSFIADIIFRRVLSECTLVITSRPSAASQLHSNISCRVEILGFTNTERQQFIQESLKDSPEKAATLQSYLDDNTDINTLCYIPLVMTILLCLFKASIELPKTQTELYQKFTCHTIVHFLTKTKGGPIKALRYLSDLEQPYLGIITKLAKISFKFLEKDKIVFSAKDVEEICPKLNIKSINCTQLGLLKETKYIDLEETNPVLSYNFLHLSLQEFLAAKYVSSLSFFQQVDILQKTFWNARYFNMWIMYMGLTAGKKNAFKYFLSSNLTSFVKNQLNKRNVIPKDILTDKVKSLHLFHCFQEAKDDSMCATIGNCFEDRTVDLNNQTLLPKDVNILCFYLLRTTNTKWNMLNLSGCNIGDIGCNELHKSLIVSDKNEIFFQQLDFSNNQLTSQSVAVIVDLVRIFEVVELNISNNPLHNMLLGFLTEFKFLKSLVTGSSTNSDDRNISQTINIIHKSSLEYVHINDKQNTSLILKISGFTKMISASYLKTYRNFIMEDCNASQTLFEHLLDFLDGQETLTYFRACNNRFNVSMIQSVCTTLANMSFIQEIVIYEFDLMASELNDIISRLLFKNSSCSITIFSKLELKCINAYTVHIFDILAEQPAINKLDVINCKTEIQESSKQQNYMNIVEDLKFCSHETNSLLAFIKALNFTAIKVLHITGANIADETADRLLPVLSSNKSLTEFIISDSEITCELAVKFIQALKRIMTLEIFKISCFGNINFASEDIKTILVNNCTVLTEVDISDNKLWNVAPIKALKSCYNLKSFKISGNNFTDEVSQDVVDILKNNSCLLEVDVTRNNFSPVSGQSFINALKDKKVLQIFRIGNCIITEDNLADVASIIFKNPGLTELDLSENHLTVSGACAVVQALGNATNVKLFKASKYMVNKDTVNDMISFFSNNSKLTVVDISANLLTSGAIKVIRSFKNKSLQILRLCNCKITQSEADELADVIKNTSLIELDLSDNQLLAIGVIIISRALKGVVSLRVLNLRNCGICDKAVDTFTGMLCTLVNLMELDISSNEFTNNVILKIINSLRITQIKVLKMNYCKIMHMGWLDIMDVFRGKNFLCLELSNSSFKVVNILQNINTLEILNISNCPNVNDENSVELSATISNNLKLSCLDFSHNNVTAYGAIQIAGAIKCITTLQTINLNNCKITDEATNEISAALICNPLVRELNISWNNLTGSGTAKILQSLKKSHFLQILNIASCGITASETEAIATVLCNKYNLIQIDISSNQLNAHGAMHVLNALSNITSLQIFKADNCAITDAATDVTATALTKLYTLTELTIHENDFSASCMKTIVKTLKVISTLKVIKLNNCLFDYMSGEIADAIGSNCGLNHLEIYSSSFTTRGASLFSKCFINIHILQHLKLINCGITEMVAGEIAAILEHNKFIEHLDLSHNPVRTGVTEILGVLNYNQVLKVFKLHSCGIKDESAHDLAIFAQVTSLIEFDILQNQLTANGALTIAQGFTYSSTLKLLKIKNWDSIYRVRENADDANYVLNTLRYKNVLFVFD